MFKDSIKAAVKQAASDVVNEIGVDAFTAKLLKYPGLIRDQQDIVKKAQQSMLEAKSILESAEAIIFAQISEEISPSTGKPKYTNKEAREAELELRKKTDMDYQAALGPFNSAQQAYDSALFDAQKLADEFKAHLVAGQIMAGRLSLLHIDL